MLDLEKPTVWGLTALHYLALQERLTGTAEIARHEGIPARALAPILRKLRLAGLLRSQAGHGYALARPAATISVAEVARILEQPGAPRTSCMDRYDACEYTESCSFAPLCREAFERTRDAMRSFTIADLRQVPAVPADCSARKKGKDVHAAV